MALFSPFDLANGNIDQSTMQFDPVGYFKRVGQSMGLVPETQPGMDPIGIVPPGAVSGVSAQVTHPPTQFMSNPGGWLAEALGQAPTSQAEAEMRTMNGQMHPPGAGSPGTTPSLTHTKPLTDPTLGRWDNLSLDEALGSHITDPVKQKTQELDDEDQAKEQEKKNNEIVPPSLKESAKEAKIKDLDMSTMQKLISQGVNPITNPHKFLAHFDALAEQNNIARSWGPLEGIRNLLSDDANALRARQKGLIEVGTFLTKKILEHESSRLGAPQTAGDVASLGSAVPLTAAQQQQKIEAPTAPGMIGPGQGIQDPNTPLQPWQQDQAMAVMKSLAGGHTMQENGQIVPTSLIAQQGRMVTPEQAQAADEIVRTPVGQPILPPSVPMQTALIDKAIGERGAMARDAAKDKRAQDKGPEFEKRLEALAATVSKQVHGQQMSYGQLVDKDPKLAEQLYNRAHVDEPQAIYSFQQNEQAKRQVAVAGPIHTAQKEADRDQPVAEPQLWRDPFTGKAASGTQTTRELQEKKFVKLRPDQVETVNQLATIDEGLNKIKEISAKLLRPEKGSLAANTLAAVGQTAYLFMLRQSGNKDVLELDRNIAFLTAPLVKSQGDTANIAVAEREMIKQALVNNQASAEAVVANIEGLQASIKKARNMMGFADVEELVERMLDAGMSKAEVISALEKRGIAKKKKK